MSNFVPPEEVKLPRAAKGKRPNFFEDPAIDQMMTFFLELMTEVSVIHERQDTMERLLDAKGSITRADVEAYRADDAVEAERATWRDAFVRRVLRMHQQD